MVMIVLAFVALSVWAVVGDIYGPCILADSTSASASFGCLLVVLVFMFLVRPPLPTVSHQQQCLELHAKPAALCAPEHEEIWELTRRPGWPADSDGVVELLCSCCH